MDPGDGPRWRLFADGFRAWVPIVVSLCAISLTMFQAMATRRHTRLSVQPRLDITLELGRGGELTYSLVNDGFGPAILKRLDYELDGEVLGPDGPATCAELDRRLGRDDRTAWQTGCFDIEGDFVIRAGDAVVLYASHRVEGAPGMGREVTPEEYLRFGASGEHCSFYDECWALE